jgi:uncharacterized membrane protein YccC
MRVVGEDRQVSDEEAQLWQASERLRCKFRLNARADEIVREIQRTVNSLPTLIRVDPKMLDEAWSALLPETSAALRELPGIKGKRKADQLGRFILSTRKNQRGAPEKHDPEIILAFCASIERVAGRKLSYGRSRDLRAKPGAPMTGPPAGAMLETLCAAVVWAESIFRPGTRVGPVKPEAILTVLRNARRPRHPRQK